MGDELLLKTGEVVSVEGRLGKVHSAEVLHAVGPPFEDLPEIPGALAAAQAREILREWGIRQLALISYEYRPGVVLSFVALLTPDQGWADLQRQHLTFRRPD